AQLSACYSNSFAVALENKLSSIAFCSISTGIYGYPIEDATHIALETTRNFLEEEGGEKAKSLEKIVFVVWSDKDKGVYEALLPEYFPETAEQEGEPDEPAPKGQAETV
ncbi:11331_t:CDS:2, partial [Acaulospora colombiana]